MSDPKDLLEKTDAFLKRYHPSPRADRANIPVLTDVVTEPAPALPTEGAATADSAAATEHPELDPKLVKSLLDAIGPQVATILEEPLRARIEAHLKRVLPALTEQINLEIEALVRETVTRAIEQEIARLRSKSRNSRS
jgi:hypothetical protein